MTRRNEAIITATYRLTQPKNAGAPKSLVSAERPTRREGYTRSETGYARRAGRGASFVIAVDESEYRGLRSWTSREAWLTAVQSVLDTPEGEALRRRISIRRKTFLRFCEVEAESAHRRHGRHVATSHETLAQRLGMSKITARRARQLMGLLDCSVTLRTGRYLTVAERLAATETHGGRQLRAASVRALVIPKNVQSVQNEHLASSRSRRGLSPVLKSQTRRGKPHSEAATRPQQRQKRAKKFVPGSDEARPLDLQRFAFELIRRMGWLPNDTRPFDVCNVLVRERFDWRRYSVSDLIGMWTAMDAAANRESLSAASVKKPLGFLRTQTKLARIWADVTRYRPAGVKADDAARERRERLARQARERAADAAARASIDQEAADRVIAQMRADMGAEKRARDAARPPKPHAKPHRS